MRLNFLMRFFTRSRFTKGVTIAACADYKGESAALFYLSLKSLHNRKRKAAKHEEAKFLPAPNPNRLRLGFVDVMMNLVRSLHKDILISSVRWIVTDLVRPSIRHP
jgi:hypothetical protein